MLYTFSLCNVSRGKECLVGLPGSCTGTCKLQVGLQAPTCSFAHWRREASLSSTRGRAGALACASFSAASSAGTFGRVCNARVPKERATVQWQNVL